MGHVMNVGASMSLQNITSATPAMHQYDFCQNEKSKIEAKEGSVERANDTRLKELNEQMDDLLTTIEEETKKQEKKTLEQQLKDRKDHLKNTFDAQTAKSVLKMEEFMQLAILNDSATSSDPDEVSDTLSEINAELNADIQDDAKEKIADQTSTSAKKDLGQIIDEKI